MLFNRVLRGDAFPAVVRGEALRDALVGPHHDAEAGPVQEPLPGLQKRMRVEFKFRTYLNCRTYTVP